MRVRKLGDPFASAVCDLCGKIVLKDPIQGLYFVLAEKNWWWCSIRIPPPEYRKVWHFCPGCAEESPKVCRDTMQWCEARKTHDP